MKVNFFIIASISSLIATSAQAQTIWKCTDKNGSTSYASADLGGCKQLASGPAIDPRWKEIARSGKSDTVYYDTKTHERSGALVKVWIMRDTDRESYKSRIGINCSTKKYATYQAATYSGPAGTGGTISSTTTPENKAVFQDATPESVMEVIIPMLCSAKK